MSEKRDQLVTFTVTKKEKLQLENLARTLGLSVSSCLRLLFKKEIVMHTNLCGRPGMEIEFK